MSIKMRVRQLNDGTEIVALIAHPMEAGDRVDSKTQEKIPAHYIQKVTFTVNGDEAAVVDLGARIAHDPVIKVRLKPTQPGDRVRLTWSDNRGDTGSKELVIARAKG